MEVACFWAVKSTASEAGKNLVRERAVARPCAVLPSRTPLPPSHV